MGARSTGSHPTTTKADGHLLEYFRQTFGSGGGGTNASPDIGLTATGGMVNQYTEGSSVYRAHVFTSSGTFHVTELGNLGNTVEYLVVAGGGAGGAHYGAGGGAGGVRTNLSGSPVSDSQTFTATAGPTSYTVTVGGGGVNTGSAPAPKSPNGSDSYFGPSSTPEGVTAKGGGSGGSNGGSGQHPGNPGGSGGGSKGTGTIGYGYNPSTPSPVTPSIPSPHPYGFTQGNNGGQGDPGAQYNGGGGGIGGAGGDAPSSAGGAGGAGLQFAIAGPPTYTEIGDYDPTPGQGQYFAGGGGGGGSASTGGIGGGGDGSPTANASNRGQENTGGGGAGRTAPGNTQLTTGGSGIVVVRYKVASLNQAKATGGYVTFYNSGSGLKTIHTFTSSGTFATEPNWTSADVEYVVIGGGGAGGPNAGTGGGAGAYKAGTTPIGSHPVSTTIAVGGGGSVSSFGSPITAPAGGNGVTNTAGNSGGSGSGGNPGGTGTGDPFPGNLADSVPSNGWGHDGGNQSNGGADRCGGGGGGAGSGGDPGNAPTIGGDGGEGIQLPATFRNPLGFKGGNGPTSAPTPNGFDTSGEFWVAGGGGGSSHYPGPQPGGSGGGAPPSISPYSTPWSGGGAGGKGNYPQFSDPERNGKSGEVNTGGGGGAAAGGGSGLVGSGGSGLVLIAYPT